jgi:hypothetical protein
MSSATGVFQLATFVDAKLLDEPFPCIFWRLGVLVTLECTAKKTNSIIRHDSTKKKEVMKG